MQPEESLATIERTVRRAIRLALPNWRELVSDRSARLAQSALDNEAAGRQGVIVTGDTLDYLYTRPAFDLIRDHWPAFEAMLGSQERIESLLSFVEDVRNTVAHGRELVTFERELVSGIAGYLTNLVALWESQSGSVAAHYPVITTIRDSFGREGSESIFPVKGNRVRVEVGEVVEFRGQATEARGQGLIWYARRADYFSEIDRSAVMQSMYPGQYSYPSEVSPDVRARGANVRFRLSFAARDVGENIGFFVAITSKSKHHRHDGVDDFRSFSFAVNPPHDA